MKNELTLPGLSGLEETTAKHIQAKFEKFDITVKEWEKKARELVVTDETQKDTMAQAREARLLLKNLRVEADKTRKDLKEESLRYGQAVQGVYNFIEERIKPIEAHLQEQEDFIKRKEAERKAKLRADREAQVSAYAEFIPVNLIFEEMSEEDFTKVLEGGKLQAQEKAKREEEAKQAEIQRQKEEAERKEAERKEAERLAAENARIAEENARVAKENARIAEENARKEAEIEAKRKEAERKEAERLAAAEKERKEAERKEAEIKAKEEESKRFEAEIEMKKRIHAERSEILKDLWKHMPGYYANVNYIELGIREFEDMVKAAEEVRDKKETDISDVSKKYIAWKGANDNDYVYDMIHEFAGELSRGELQRVFEYIANEKA